MTTSERTEDRAKRTTLWYDLVLDDERPLPEYLRERFRTTRRANTSRSHRYTSREWHLLEREHLWRKVWQMACREEHIPDVGSYALYDIAGDSYIIVRTRKALRPATSTPACTEGAPPEGLRRTLQRSSAAASTAFTWRLDGTLRHTPAPAEFPRSRPTATRGAFRKPRSACGAGSCSSIPIRTPNRSRTSSARCRSTSPGGTSSIVTCRHTSPRRSVAIGRSPRKRSTRDCTSAPPIPSRLPTLATPTPPSTSTETMRGRSARPARPIEDLPVDATETDILKRMLDVREGEDLPIPFSQRSTARDAMARAGRERWRQALGDEADDISDAELVDHWNYIVFPNFHPWGGYNRIIYRFRPNGDRHDESIFEVMFLTPYRGERPATAEVTNLDFEDSWTKAPELQTLGLVMEQDTFNMEAVQRGLETTTPTLRDRVDGSGGHLDLAP